MTERSRVLLVDDHEMARRGLAAMLATAPWIDVVGEADSCEAGIEAIRALVPDVVLLDIRMPGSDGLACLERTATPPAIRVIDAVRQMGRLKRDILAVGPTELIPGAEGRPSLEWWISSWESTYQELHVSDIRSVAELAAVTFDAGVQLGAGGPQGTAARKELLSSLASLDSRLRKETSTVVEELIAGWRELAAR